MSRCPAPLRGAGRNLVIATVAFRGTVRSGHPGIGAIPAHAWHNRDTRRPRCIRAIQVAPGCSTDSPSCRLKLEDPQSTRWHWGSLPQGLQFERFEGDGVSEKVDTDNSTVANGEAEDHPWPTADRPYRSRQAVDEGEPGGFGPAGKRLGDRLGSACLG